MCKERSGRLTRLVEELREMVASQGKTEEKQQVSGRKEGKLGLRILSQDRREMQGHLEREGEVKLAVSMDQLFNEFLLLEREVCFPRSPLHHHPHCHPSPSPLLSVSLGDLHRVLLPGSGGGPSQGVPY